MTHTPFALSALMAALLLAAAAPAGASSHREAPFITTSPKVDGTDFYMFRSYEGVAANGSGGRSDYVTLLANYQPLQGPYGGCLLYTSPSPRDRTRSRMPSSA